jgi:hypothetical protein
MSTTAAVAPMGGNGNANVIELQCLSLKHLFTVIRDQNTERGEYVR